MISPDFSFSPFSVERGAPSSQWVQLLSLQNFRCYDSFTLEVDQRPVVLTGENGAGKTNILEALSFLSPGRGLRRTKLSQAINLSHLEKGWAVFSKISTPEGLEEIGTGIASVESGEDRRLIKLNQTPISQVDLLEKVSVFWVTPQIDQILTESMSTRRRFFDKLVASFFPAHGQHLYRYDYALRERSRLLKDGGGDPHWLSVLEQKMAQEGMAITSLRHLFLAEITPLIHLSSSGFPQAQISLEGVVESLCLSMPALEAEEKIEGLLRDTRAEDTRLGGSQIGPHQTQVQFFHMERKKFAEFCSTGEQKALLLSLILANCRLHKKSKSRTPILLLDEVVAHLDKERRETLYKEILDLGMQCWMTGTEQRVFSSLRDEAQYFYVQNRNAVRQTMKVE